MDMAVVGVVHILVTSIHPINTPLLPVTTLFLTPRLTTMTVIMIATHLTLTLAHVIKACLVLALALALVLVLTC